MSTQFNAEELKRRYEAFAKSLDYRTTACDYQLRELEIDTAAAEMRNGMSILDVGCGLGYAVCQYAHRFKLTAHGIDYAAAMIEGAQQLMLKNFPHLASDVCFLPASVLQLPYRNDSFDVVTSHRCLMALLEIHRVLKRGGKLVLMEGTFEGLAKLNETRQSFGLEQIAPDGRDRLFTLKFHEPELLAFCEPHYTLEKIQRFGMYYFLTRVVQPLLVAPEPPSYDHKLNAVAREIARKFPDFEGMGHLVAFVFRKRGHAR